MFVTTIVLTALLAVAFTYTSVIKLIGIADMRASAEHLGFSYPTYRGIGALETAAVIGLLIGLFVPALGVAAAAGLVLLMTGAAVTHLRAGDGRVSAVPATLGVLAVLYLVFRIASS
jgi:hypothetical protein